MGALSTFAAAGLQNLTMRGDAFASPTDVYLGWFTTPPAPDGSATEVTGGGYAREIITFAAPEAGSITSDADVTFAPLHAGADQMLAGWGIFDAATAGNLLAYGRVPSLLVRFGATFEIAAGDITITSNGAAMSNYLADAWLDHLFTNSAYTPPGGRYFGAYTTTPTATTAGVEVDTAGYDRLSSAWDTSYEGESYLTDAVLWSPLTSGDPQTLAGWAVCDANTAGNVLWFYSWPTPIEAPVGDTLELPGGSIILRAL